MKCGIPKWEVTIGGIVKDMKHSILGKYCERNMKWNITDFDGRILHAFLDQIVLVHI
jgi:hypothetical protein